MAFRWTGPTRLVIASVVVVVMAGTIALRLWVVPRVDAAGTADVVVVLGGGGPRERYGLDLVADGVADDLVFFSPFFDELDLYGVRSCNTRPPELDDDVGLECFVPRPRTTRGEMRRVAELARDRGWDEIVVVASTDQITRARMLLARCWDDGEARFLGPDHDDPWYVRVGYEAGAMAKALVIRSC